MMQTKQLIKTEDGLYEIRENGTLVEGPCKITQFSAGTITAIKLGRIESGNIECSDAHTVRTLAWAREARG